MLLPSGVPEACRSAYHSGRGYNTAAIADDQHAQGRKLIVHIVPGMQGRKPALPRPSWGDMVISWLGAFLAILAIAGVNQALLPELHASLLVASFGAHSAREVEHTPALPVTHLSS